MPSLKDLRNRIQSVKNTQQITKTMKMVAAAKVRRARSNVDAARPYAERLNQILVNVSLSVGDTGPLLLAGRKDVKKARLIIFGSDRGLCGGFNANLMKKVAEKIREWQAIKVEVDVVTVGRKARDGMRILNRNMIAAEFLDVGKKINFELADEIAKPSVDAFEAGEIDSVELVFVECVSMLNQDPHVQPLIPFAAKDAAVDTAKAAASFEYEPEESAIIADILPRNIRMQVYKALLESNASEQAARMTAMDNATRNAGEMIDKLSTQYNRSRQAAITTELIEIIAGAESV